jgi:hypothetical protein
MLSNNHKFLLVRLKVIFIIKWRISLIGKGNVQQAGDYYWLLLYVQQFIGGAVLPEKQHYLLQQDMPLIKYHIVGILINILIQFIQYSSRMLYVI